MTDSKKTLQKPAAPPATPRLAKEPRNSGSSLKDLNEALIRGSTPEAREALKPLFEQYRLKLDS